MRPLVYQIDDIKTQRTVYKGYTIVYEGNSRTKHWCDGVETTYGKAEKAAKKLITIIRAKSKGDAKN